jgi:type II secretory pathway pseudopilin PulG
VNKAGFTLVESMVALLLTVLVLGLVYRLLVGQQRTASLQAQRVLLQANLRSAAAFISTDLRDVSTDSTNLDLLAFAPESVTYRATRGSGIACRVSPTSVELLGEPYGAFRRPQPGRDSLMIYVAAGPGRDWLSGPVTAIGVSTCGGASSLRLSTLLDSVTLAAASPGPLFPVRLFEIMQIKLYQSQGSSWLGARSVSAGEVIQPVLGPLETNGLWFTFRDSAGGFALRASAVRSGEVVIRVVAAQAVAGSFGAPRLLRDSVRVALPLRNAVP